MKGNNNNCASENKSNNNINKSVIFNDGESDNQTMSIGNVQNNVNNKGSFFIGKCSHPKYIMDKDDLIFKKLGFTYTNFIMDMDGSTPMFVDTSDFRTVKSVILTFDIVINAGDTKGICIDPSDYWSAVKFYTWSSGASTPTVTRDSTLQSKLLNYCKHKVVCCNAKLKQVGILMSSDGYGTIIEGVIAPSTFDPYLSGLNPLNINVHDNFKIDTVDGRAGVFSYLLGNPYSEYIDNEKSLHLLKPRVLPVGPTDIELPPQTLLYSTGTIYGRYKSEVVSIHSTIGGLKYFDSTVDHLECNEMMFVENVQKASKMYFKISPPSQTVTYKLTVKFALEVIPNFDVIEEIPMYQPPFIYNTQRIFSSIITNIRSFMTLEDFQKYQNKNYNKLYAMTYQKIVINNEFDEGMNAHTQHAIENFDINKNKIIKQDGLLVKTFGNRSRFEKNNNKIIIKKFIEDEERNKYSNKNTLKFDHLRDKLGLAYKGVFKGYEHEFDLNWSGGVIDYDDITDDENLREYEMNKISNKLNKNIYKPRILDIESLDSEFKRKVEIEDQDKSKIKYEGEMTKNKTKDKQDEFDVCYAMNKATRKKKVVSNVIDRSTVAIPDFVDKCVDFLGHNVAEVNYDSSYTRLLKTGSTKPRNINWQYFPVIVAKTKEVVSAICCLKAGSHASQSFEITIYDQDENERKLSINYEEGDLEELEPFKNFVEFFFNQCNAKYFVDFEDKYTIRFFAPAVISQTSYAGALAACIMSVPCGQFISSNIDIDKEKGLVINPLDREILTMKARLTTPECPLLYLAKDPAATNVGTYIISGIRTEEYDLQNVYIVQNIDLFYTYLFLPSKGKHAQHTPMNIYKGMIKSVLANRQRSYGSRYIFCTQTNDMTILSDIAQGKKVTYPASIVGKFRVDNWVTVTMIGSKLVDFTNFYNKYKEIFIQMNIPYFIYNNEVFVYKPVINQYKDVFMSVSPIQNINDTMKINETNGVLNGISGTDVISVAKERIEVLQQSKGINSVNLAEEKLQKIKMLMNAKKENKLDRIKETVEIKIKDEKNPNVKVFPKVTIDDQLIIKDFFQNGKNNIKSIDSGKYTIAKNEDALKLIAALGVQTKIKKGEESKLDQNFINILEDICRKIDLKIILYFLQDNGIIKGNNYTSKGVSVENYKKLYNIFKKKLKMDEEREDLIKTSKKEKKSKENDSDSEEESFNEEEVYGDDNFDHVDYNKDDDE